MPSKWLELTRADVEGKLYVKITNEMPILVSASKTVTKFGGKEVTFVKILNEPMVVKETVDEVIAAINKTLDNNAGC